MRRFSIEAFSRASSDDLRQNIMSLNDVPTSDDHVRKAESRGHNRNFSASSQLSSSSYTSGTSSSSLATRRSSSISDSQSVDIYRADELIPGAMSGVSLPPSAYRPIKAIKAIFRRSRLQGKELIEVRKPGSVDRKGLEAVISAHRGPLDEVISFKMASPSYIAYSRLAEALDYLSLTLPNVQDVVLYAQVYTLEELNGLTPFISRFSHLRSFAVFDALDDPPMVCPTLCKIITLWAVECTSLQRVQFWTGSWWEPKEGDAFDEKERTAEWAECSAKTA